MNVHFEQAGRVGTLATVIGPDALVLLRMDGSEELSGDFTWTVEALSERADIDLHALLGTHATVSIDHANGTRAFDGIVTQAQARGTDENGFRYDLTLRPWLHVAGLRRNMRIFHDQTVIDIIRAVLSDYAGLGAPHLDVQVTRDYPLLEYTVQYGESDAHFVRRQMERHGISWSWRHEAGNHTLILTDTASSLPEVPGITRPFYRVAEFHQHDEEHFSHWSPGQRMTTGAVQLTEYNFKIPTATQDVNQIGDATHPSGQIESYDWPGDYLEQAQGRGVVTDRVDEERGQAPRHHAEGDVVSLGAGWRVTLGGDDVVGATGRGFVCLKATHRFRAQAYGTGDAGGDEVPYTGHYTLIPDDTPYRPERRTVGPRVQGPETAVVVGAGEIDCDEHGRILCQFHWDLEGAHTMRCRVSQNWASKGWGGMVIPRIGMEVIVEHLRGDPDKPIVTGCVYNGQNTPPYDLPEHKTRSTFKTNTHQGTGYNELRFEDENGREEIFIHAEKDRNEKTKNNHSERIDNNWLQSIGSDKSIVVEDDHDEIIGGNMTINVGGNAAASTVAKNLSRFSQGLGGLAKALRLHKIPGLGRGNLFIQTERNRMDVTGMTHTETIGIAKSVVVGGRINLQAGAEIDLHGERMTEIDSNGTTSLSGAEKVTINSGESRIIMEADGTIHLHGNVVNMTATKSMHLEAGNDITIKSGSTVTVQSGRIDLN